MSPPNAVKAANNVAIASTAGSPPDAEAPAVEIEAPVPLGNLDAPRPTPFDSGLSSPLTAYFLSPSSESLQIRAALSDLERKLPVLSGPALAFATERVGQLTRLQKITEDLETLDIRRPDVLELKRFLVSKIRIGREHPVTAQDLGKLEGAVDKLKKVVVFEKKKDAARAFFESEYPQDPRLRFRTDCANVFDGQFSTWEGVWKNANPPEGVVTLDPWKDPSLEKLEGSPKFEAHRFFNDGIDPKRLFGLFETRTFGDKERAENKRIAQTISGLMRFFRDGETFGISGSSLITSFGALDQYLATLESFFSDGAVEAFAQKVREIKADNHASNPSGKAAMAVGDSKRMLKNYPDLINILENYGSVMSRAGKRITSPELIKMLRDTCADLAGRWETIKESGGKELAANESFKGFDANASELKAFVKHLEELDPKKANQQELVEMAKRTGAVARALFPMEEAHLRLSLTQLITHIEKLPSKEPNIAPIREALLAISASAAPKLEDRMKAYDGVLKMIEKASLVRVIDAKIELTFQQDRQYVSRDSSLGGLGALAGASFSSVHAHQSYSEKIRSNTFHRMMGEYRELRKLATSNDLADVEKARQELQRLESVGMQKTLSTMAKNAQTFNEWGDLIANGVSMLFVFTGAGAAASLGGRFLSLGTRSLLSRGAFAGLSAGAKNLITRGVTYVGSMGLFTGVRRLGASALHLDGNDESGFLGDYVSDLAMVGFINGVMKGAQSVAGKVLESLAKRNLGGKAGMVLAEGAEDAAKAALEAEKARMLENIWCEAGRRFGSFGVEYVAFQTFEYLKTVGTLLVKEVKDPLEKAWNRLASPLALAHGAAFLLGAKGLHSSVSELIMEPITAKFQDAAESIQFSTLERELNQDRAKLEKDQEVFESKSPEEMFGDPLKSLQEQEGLIQRQQELLQRKQSLLSWAHGKDPRPENEQQLIKNQQEFAENHRKLSTIGLVTNFFKGMNGLFGENNPYGIRPSASEGSFLYPREGAQKILDAFKQIPWVNKDGIVVGKNNGYIEITLNESPFMPDGPQTIRLIPAESQAAPVRQNAGVAQTQWAAAQ